MKSPGQRASEEARREWNSVTNMDEECRFCNSTKLIKLNTEVCLHFPGLKAVNKNPIFVFPKVTLCLDCGFVAGQLSATEVKSVTNSAAESDEICV